MNLPRASRHALAKVHPSLPSAWAAASRRQRPSAARSSPPMLPATSTSTNTTSRPTSTSMAARPTTTAQPAGVDDGVYVYQITNPSGTVILSKRHHRSPRVHRLSGGVIVSATDHVTVAGDCGGVRVQMFPFDDTPNNGGVYKALDHPQVRLQSPTATSSAMATPRPTTSTSSNRPKPRSPTSTSTSSTTPTPTARGSPDEVPLFGWAMTASATATA